MNRTRYFLVALTVFLLIGISLITTEHVSYAQDSTFKEHIEQNCPGAFGTLATLELNQLQWIVRQHRNGEEVCVGTSGLISIPGFGQAGSISCATSTDNANRSPYNDGQYTACSDGQLFMFPGDGGSWNRDDGPYYCKSSGLDTLISIFDRQVPCARFDPPLSACTAETLVSPTLKSPDNGALDTDGKPTLEWDFEADCQIDMFVVYLNDAPGWDAMRQVDAEATSWVPENELVCNETYFWQVFAVAGDELKSSDQWAFSPSTGCTDSSEEDSEEDAETNEDQQSANSPENDNGATSDRHFLNGDVPIVQGMRAYDPTGSMFNELTQSAGSMAAYVQSVVIFGTASANQNSSGSSSADAGTSDSSSSSGDGGSASDNDSGSTGDSGGTLNPIVTSDRDGDGYNNLVDPCPDQPGDEWTNNGCPDTDRDMIPDNQDLCPVDKGIDFTGCPDTDGDFVSDPMDTCPQHAGVPWNLGCPWEDVDGDGIGDRADSCPDDAGPKEYNGCPWDLADADGDHVANHIDNCVYEWGSTQDGCPDSDGDGIADWLDECPLEVGAPGAFGCPWTDEDGDGLPPWYDECPAEWGKLADAGCPDNDGDGVSDIWDVCPDTVGNNPSGCPDTDEDGVHDGIDVCPETRGAPGLFGCPVGGVIAMNSVLPDTSTSPPLAPSGLFTSNTFENLPCATLNTMTWGVDGASGSVDILTEPNCPDGGYKTGTPVIVQASPDNGSVVQQLDLCGTQSELSVGSFTVTNSCTVSASFSTVKCNTVNLATNSNGGTGRVFLDSGSNCPWGDGFLTGTVVNAIAVADSGEFSHWSTDCIAPADALAAAPANQYPIATYKSCTITAHFTDALVCRSVGLQVIGGNDDTEVTVAPAPNCDGNRYSEGTTVYFTTQDDVANWSGCGSLNSEAVWTQITVTEDCVMEARFGDETPSTHNGSDDCTGCHVSPGGGEVSPNLSLTTSLSAIGIASDNQQDTDSDGVIDIRDRCPETPGLRVLNGCPMASTNVRYSRDIRVSGYGLMTSAIAPFASGGVYTSPFEDLDNDGIPNGIDRCPETPGEFTNSGCPVQQLPEACVLLADRTDITVRVGPGLHRGIFGSLSTAKESYGIVGFAEANDGSLWWKLDKSQVPNSASANSLWVNQADANTSGNCDQLGTVEASPYIAPPPTATPPPISEPQGNTDSADWGACGSCNTCAGPQNECILTSDGQCLWNPGGCSQQSTSDGGGNPPPPPPPQSCYSVNVSTVSAGGGQGTASVTTPQNCGGGYLAGTTVAIRAITTNGAAISWGGCGGSGSDGLISVTANSSCTVTVRFVIN